MKLKTIHPVSFLVWCFLVSLVLFFPTMAKDTYSEHSGPPSNSTFERLSVQPTNYTYTSIDSKTTQLEVLIMGEGCANWRDVDQTSTGWPNPSNYNWYDQDIRAPFQFPYDLTMISVKAVMIELRIFDVDSPSEIDIVHLNDINIGTLDGADDTWVWNTFFPSVGIIVQGENHIDIDIDTTHTTKYWAMTVDWIKVTIIYQQLTIQPPQPPQPPPSKPQPVGGSWTPINKFKLLVPWITTVSLMAIAASIACVEHRKRQQD